MNETIGLVYLQELKHKHKCNDGDNIDVLPGRKLLLGKDLNDSIIEYSSTLYVGLQLKQNGYPLIQAMVKSRKAFLKLQKVSSLHYHAFL